MINDPDDEGVFYNKYYFRWLFFSHLCWWNKSSKGRSFLPNIWHFAISIVSLVGLREIWRQGKIIVKGCDNYPISHIVEHGDSKRGADSDGRSETCCFSGASYFHCLESNLVDLGVNWSYMGIPSSYFLRQSNGFHLQKMCNHVIIFSTYLCLSCFQNVCLLYTPLEEIFFQFIYTTLSSRWNWAKKRFKLGEKLGKIERQTNTCPGKKRRHMRNSKNSKHTRVWNGGARKQSIWWDDVTIYKNLHPDFME